MLSKEHKWILQILWIGGNSVIDEEVDTIEDIESYSPSVQKIDTVITVLAVIHIFAGILAIPTVMILFTSSIYQVPLIITIMILIDGSVLIASIPLYLILGWAIWSLQPWAWKISVMTNIVFLLTYLIGGIILPALLCIVFLFALYSSDVRQALAPINQ